MASPYHIGAQNIATRLGYKSQKMVMKLVARDGLPVYKRYERHRTGCCMKLAISESALTAWEISKGRHFVASVRAKRDPHSEH